MKVYIKQNGFLNNPNITQEEIDKLLADGFTEIELDDKYSDCTFLDFDGWKIFNINKFNERRQKMVKEDTKNKIISLIRERYSIDDEMAILRQRDTKPDEFAEYNAFVEACKRKAKDVL